MHSAGVTFDIQHHLWYDSQRKRYWLDESQQQGGTPFNVSSVTGSRMLFQLSQNIDLKVNRRCTCWVFWEEHEISKYRPVPCANQEGSTTASAFHRVLAAPSGGPSRGSPGCSRRRRWWCWRWSTWTLRGGTSAGWRGCWAEWAWGRCRRSAAQRIPQVLWSAYPCWWAWPGWERSGCAGSSGTSSDHSGPVEQSHVDELMIIAAALNQHYYTQWVSCLLGKRKRWFAVTHRELSHDSAVYLSFADHLSIFQLIYDILPI